MRLFVDTIKGEVSLMVTLLCVVAHRAVIRVIDLLERWADKERNGEMNVSWGNRCCLHIGVAVTALAKIAEFVEEKVEEWENCLPEMVIELEDLREKVDEMEECYYKSIVEYERILDYVLCHL